MTIKCPICTRDFIGDDADKQLFSHLITHIKTPNICPVCNKQISNDFNTYARSTSINHIRFSHPEITAQSLAFLISLNASPAK